MTIKEELAQAQAKIDDLEKTIKAHEDLQTQLTEANTNLKAAEKARDAANEASAKAGTDLKAATDRAEKAEKEAGDHKASAEKASKEAGEAKASESTMREQLAARGIKPVKKPASASENDGKGNAATADELREQLNASTDPAEKFTLSQQLRKLETSAKN